MRATATEARHGQKSVVNPHPISASVTHPLLNGTGTREPPTQRSVGARVYGVSAHTHPMGRSSLYKEKRC